MTRINSSTLFREDNADRHFFLSDILFTDTEHFFLLWCWTLFHFHWPPTLGCYYPTLTTDTRPTTDLGAFFFYTTDEMSDPCLYIADILINETFSSSIGICFYRIMYFWDSPQPIVACSMETHYWYFSKFSQHAQKKVITIFFTVK